MTSSLNRDIQSVLNPIAAAPLAAATAAGSGDATLVHGTAIDVTALNTPGGSATTPSIEGLCRYESVMFVLTATTTLADTKALTVTASIETSAASNFGTSTTLLGSATVISKTSAGGGTYQVVGKLGCSLEQALQYVRVSFTPDLSASGTDTSSIQAVAVFGGPQELP